MMVRYKTVACLGFLMAMVTVGLPGLLPSQGFAGNLAIRSLLPDMGASVLVGGARLPWATQFTLNGSQARARRDNRCGFSFAYELVNSGNQSLPVRATFVNAISTSVSQQPLHLGNSFVLRPGDKKTISGTLYLLNGLNNLRFRVEAASGVVEKAAAVFLTGC